MDSKEIWYHPQRRSEKDLDINSCIRGWLRNDGDNIDNNLVEDIYIMTWG